MHSPDIQYKRTFIDLYLLLSFEIIKKKQSRGYGGTYTTLINEEIRGAPTGTNQGRYTFKHHSIAYELILLPQKTISTINEVGYEGFELIE